MTTQANVISDYYGSKLQPATQTTARPEDVASTTAIIHALYECISGPAGQPRDWERMRSLCVAGARSIRLGVLADGSTSCKIMNTSDEYVRQMDGWLLENGFYETEVHRVEQRFGHIAHVFSTYESRRTLQDPHPYMRGINSIQLLFDGSRWWVLQVLWQHESADFPLPEEYL